MQGMIGKATALALVGLALLAGGARAESSAVRTLRVDYYHTGKAGAEEIFALDRVVVEPLPWPGNPKRPLDDSGLGEYYFEVADRATQVPLYSRGFSTWFDVWQATFDARGRYRTFEESLRFPEPAKPVIVRVRRREGPVDFKEVWSFVIDPADPSIARGAPPAAGRVVEIQKRGPSSRKLDLLFLGDGYTSAERDEFLADARRLTAALFEHEPFGDRRDDLNVWALLPEARDAGVTRRSAGIERASPLGTAYDVLDIPSNLATLADRDLRAIASNAPYDALVILSNSNVYGGSGIFNGAAVVAAKSVWAPYLIAHELGQSLAGLAVENFTWEWANAGGGFFSYGEPWQRNITLGDAPESIKWRDLLTPGVPLDTPWEKDAYRSVGWDVRDQLKTMREAHRPESDFDAAREEEKKKSTEMLAHGKAPDGGGEPADPSTVGAFEGAAHQEHIYNRPQLDCVMFSRDDVDFCAVCRRELDAVISLYSK